MTLDELQLRAHDLPVAWEGRAVLWRGWEPPPPGPLFICPPSATSSCCEGCGSLAAQPSNRGMVARWTSMTVEDLEAAEENRRRLGPLAHKARPLGYYELVAHRCPDCRLDVVVDYTAGGAAGVVWTLDLTDYGDQGSTFTPPDPAAVRQAAIARTRAAINPTRTPCDEALW